MRCPKCGCLDDKVIDSRVVRDGAAVRRRRECLSCSCRYTTIEGFMESDGAAADRAISEVDIYLNGRF